MTDEELIRGCIKQDRSAQRMLYEQYFGKMMGICIRFSKNNVDARDIFQNAFRNIFANPKSFLDENTSRKKDSPPLLPEDWIKKIIIRSAVEHLHKNKKEYFVSSTVNVRDAEKTSSEEISDEQIMNKANIQFILKALQQLTPSYRAIYNLHEVDGYSHKEISALLDISEYTSKDSLSKAKFNMRRNLARMTR